MNKPNNMNKANKANKYKYVWYELTLLSIIVLESDGKILPITPDSAILLRIPPMWKHE